MTAGVPEFERRDGDLGGLLVAVSSLGTIVAGAVFFYLVNPVTSRLVPPCPFLWATGCYCPGCGAARTFHSLARADLGAAVSFNPLLVLALPVLGYFYVSFLGRQFLGRSLPFPVGLAPYTWLIPIVIVAFWILRNLPWVPFTWLAP